MQLLITNVCGEKTISEGTTPDPTNTTAVPAVPHLFDYPEFSFRFIPGMWIVMTESKVDKEKVLRFANKFGTSYQKLSEYIKNLADGEIEQKSHTALKY